MKNILEHFLDALEVPYTRHFAEALYNEHPHKYNMFGLRMMLSVYGVRTIGIKIPDKNLAFLTYPCILHTHDDFVIAMNVEDDRIKYLQNGSKITQPLDKFKRVWTGNALVVEETTDATEPNLSEHTLQEYVELIKDYGLIVMASIVAVVGFIVNFDAIGFYGIPLTMLSAIGTVICLMLVQRQAFGESRYVDKVCDLFRHSNCNSVLDGVASGFLNVSWSVVGSGYFITSALLLTLYPQAQYSVSIIIWIAMLYGVWSIHYQWRIARSWCALCVAVQVVVWLMGLTSIFSAVTIPQNFNCYEFIIVGMTYFSGILIVNCIVESIKSKSEASGAIQQYRAIKVKKEVAEALINDGKYYETSIDDSCIIFGPRDAKTRVTIFSNPHCNPCAKMHEKVETLLELENEGICIQYVFTSFSKELEDSSRYLISCYIDNNEAEARRLFDKWYSVEKYERMRIVKNHGERLYSSEIETEMRKHRIWRDKTALSSTPTILVNGHLLPKEYELMDIPMMTNLDVKKNIIYDIGGRSTTPSGADQLSAEETV